jgi:hypothetical protein
MSCPVLMNPFRAALQQKTMASSWIVGGVQYIGAQTSSLATDRGWGNVLRKGTGVVQPDRGGDRR